MPKLNGKHFSYSKEGMKAYKKAKKKMSNKSYSKDDVKLARQMMKK